MSLDQRAQNLVPFFTKSVESADGIVKRIGVRAANGQWEMTVDGLLPEQRILGTVGDSDLEQTLASIAGIYEIDVNVTRIDCVGIELHDLLGKLVWVGGLDSVASAPACPDDLFDTEEIFASGQYALEPGLRVIPSFIRVNGSQLAVLADARRAAFLPMDLEIECQQVVITRPILQHAWSKDRPMCVFAGTSEWGYSGPYFWTCLETGDQDSGQCVIELAPAEDTLIDVVFAMLSSEPTNALTFILGHVGLPDSRTEQKIDRYFFYNYENQESFNVGLPAADIDVIFQRLVKQSAWYEKLVEALQNQSTALGKIVYSWAQACCNDEASLEDFLSVVSGDQTHTFEELQELKAGDQAHAVATPVAQHPGELADPNTINPFTKQPYKFD